jgi:hypothetical protein
VKKTKSVAATRERERRYGALSKSEWIELDGWVFQEVPENVYALFERLLRHHGVPMQEWLDK